MFSELLTALDVVRSHIARWKENGEIERLRSMRNALKEVYFSDRTVEAIKSIRESIDTEDYDYLVGKLAIIQRDTEKPVGHQLNELQVLENTEHLSIGAQRAIKSISQIKYGIRGAICEAILQDIWRKDPVQLDELVTKIERLNEDIETLDGQLGGIFL